MLKICFSGYEYIYTDVLFMKYIVYTKYIHLYMRSNSFAEQNSLNTLKKRILYYKYALTSTWTICTYMHASV